MSNLANELLQGLFSILVVARVAILTFTGAMALYRTDLAPEIVNHALTALIFGLAAAGAWHLEQELFDAEPDLTYTHLQPT